MGLYIETRIRADLDDLWAHTQDPARQQRWDLRFTRLTHLPRAEGEPQRFRYAVRVLPFLTLTGTGVTAGDREHPDGTRTSALRLACPHPLSPLAESSGYWSCVSDAHGVQFLAAYDHRPRWGAAGTVADRLLVRPLMGWATAWSFDRLRLWLERGITPERALANWLAELAVRSLIVTVCLAGLGRGPFLRAFGPLTAAVAYLCPLLLMLLLSLALFKAPFASTPAARRCLRTPVIQTGVPCVLRTLERPVREEART
ncbi:hypothetical protein [Streptomyces sp. NPDC005573]|uniref:hypothetical protein n=1 Tax=unclassified Streptomyces TaxID=2593676 RepID=UPI0033B36354